MHPGHPVQLVHTPTQAQQGGQKAGRRSGVSNEKGQGRGLCATSWNFPASSIDGDVTIRGFLWSGLDADEISELHHAIHHHLGVFTPECTAKDGFPFREGSKNDRAVGDAFGPGDDDRGLSRALGRDKFNDIGQ